MLYGANCVSTIYRLIYEKNLRLPENFFEADQVITDLASAYLACLQIIVFYQKFFHPLVNVGFFPDARTVE